MMDKPMPVWEPNKGAQYTAWTHWDVDQILFGGGRGSGKSSWILGTFLTQLGMYGPHASGMILRRQFRDLKELIKQGKEMFVHTGMAKYNAQDHALIFTPPYVGATLEFGNLDRIDDYSRYHGRAFSYIAFDEITEFESWEMVERMGSTLRSKHKGVKPVMRFTGNPGGQLHQQVKRRFIDPWPRGNRVLRTKSGQTRMYVHSTVHDNPYIFNNNPEYMVWLNSLSPVLYKAWYEGCWDIAIGAFFADIWNQKKHVVDPFRPTDVPGDWEIFRCFDWGSSKPYACLYYTISNGEPMRDGRMFPRGAIIFLWEQYGQDPTADYDTGVRWSSSQVAKHLRHFEDQQAIHGRVKAGPADTQLWADIDGYDGNLYRNFVEEGIEFVKANKSSGTIASGLEQIRTRLIGGDHGPMMYFSSSCTHTNRTMPDIPRHEYKLEEIADRCEDHLCDCVRYVCLTTPIEIRYGVENKERPAPITEIR